jgi:hypothetical protein
VTIIILPLTQRKYCDGWRPTGSADTDEQGVAAVVEHDAGNARHVLHGVLEKHLQNTARVT